MSAAEASPSAFRVVDAHVHFYDSRTNRHAFLEEADPVYEALVGDYAALLRSYLHDAYLADTAGHAVQGVVWHEYQFDDASRRPSGPIISTEQDQMFRTAAADWFRLR